MVRQQVRNSLRGVRSKVPRRSGLSRGLASWGRGVGLPMDEALGVCRGSSGGGSTCPPPHHSFTRPQFAAMRTDPGEGLGEWGQKVFLES